MATTPAADDIFFNQKLCYCQHRTPSTNEFVKIVKKLAHNNNNMTYMEFHCPFLTPPIYDHVIFSVGLKLNQPSHAPCNFKSKDQTSPVQPLKRETVKQRKAEVSISCTAYKIYSKKQNSQCERESNIHFNFQAALMSFLFCSYINGIY